jgi:hypothetical protein
MSMFDSSILVARLNFIAEQKRSGRDHGLYMAGEHILGESNEHVPFEDGDTARTGEVSQDSENGDTAISYDDVEFNGQVVMLHEDMEMRHDENRNAKFLENAMQSEREIALQIVATSIQRSIGL